MSRISFFLFFFVWGVALFAQSGLYIPSAKPVRNMQKALVNPDAFCLLIQYSGSERTYAVDDLDLLDSAYRIAFSHTNPKMYTMVIEAYGAADEQLLSDRVDNVLQYFTSRCHTPFPVRYANNTAHCSCKGDTVETIRYEVPLSLKTYDCAELPDSRKVLNGSIQLQNTVLVTFRHNPAECIGLASGCFLPGQDTTIRGYYTSLSMPKGAVYSVSGTKDDCPPSLSITIDEHFDYKSLVERYFLVPHPKQIIAQAGYIVLNSSFKRQPGECKLEMVDSIIINIPITQEQWDNKLRVFTKVLTDKGMEYKMISARKSVNKVTGTMSMNVAINASMFDTIFFAKKIKKDEIKDYFYPVDNDREQGSFKVDGNFYKAFVMNRKGEYESKKAFKVLFRQEVEQEEDKEKASFKEPDEEEIEE